MFQTFFYSKSTQREIGSSKAVQRALEVYLGTRALEGHLGTRVLKGHLGTRDARALEGYLGTRALKAFTHLGTEGLVHSGN